MRATRYPHTSVSTSPKRYASGKITIAAGTENGPTTAIFTAMMFDATSVATKSDEMPRSSGLGMRCGSGLGHVEPHSVEDLRREQTWAGTLRGDVRDLGHPVSAHQGLAARARAGGPGVHALRPRRRAPGPDRTHTRRRSVRSSAGGGGSSPTRSSRWACHGCCSPMRSCASRAHSPVCWCQRCRSSACSSAS